MSTVRKSRVSPPRPPDEDPFRYGWRYVTQVQANGRKKAVQVPLTVEDVLHPQEEDFIVNNTLHDWIRTYLKYVMESALAEMAGTLVLSDCRVAWDVPGLRGHGPDIAVVFGVRRMRRLWATFDVVEEGVRPELIIEITSPDPDCRRNDLVIKRQHYYRARVPFYVIIDLEPETGEQPVRLLGYRRGPRGYQRIQPNNKGQLWLEPVRLWLGIEGDQVACFDEQGQRIGSYAEVTRARAAAETRVRKLEEEIRRLRKDNGGGLP